MINYNDLQNIDNSIEVISKKSEINEVLGISLVDNLKPQHILFIKDNKFLRKLETNLKDQKDSLDMILVLEEKIAEKIKDSDAYANLEKSFNIIAKVKSVPLAICAFSKPFYDEKVKSYNDMVDGRQMGTTEIHPTAEIAQNVFIGKNVKIGENVKIYPGCQILSNSEIGEGTILFPNVVIYQNVKIGKACRLHAGTIIGSDGYGYNFDQGVHHKIWHYGGVIIGDYVEFGASCAVDCGTFEPTLINSGTKIDNHVHIAHNCKVGNGVILCGQAGLAGSATLGDFVVLGGKAGIAPDVNVGMATQVAGAAMVAGDWPAQSMIGGHPARDLKEWMKGVATLRKLSLEKKK